MRLGGLDISSNRTGYAIADGERITATSFRPNIPRRAGIEKGQVDYNQKAKIFREYRDFTRAWLIQNAIEYVGIEEPLRSDLTRKRPKFHGTNAMFAGQAISYEEGAATSFAAIFGIYPLVGVAIELCDRLNIPFKMVNQSKWRSSFMGLTRAPKGTKDGTKWLKERSQNQCALAGIEVKNGDEADACGVVFWLRGELNPRMGAQVGMFEAKP